MLRLLIAAVFAMVSVGIASAGNDITLTSPNGFAVGGIDGTTVNCTFFADGMAKKSGWQLHFSPSPGNAKTWATRVTNATKTFVPTAGSIMVLDSFAGTTQGHV